MEFINIVLAFLEGLALVASPCILPILPIILAGSIGKSKKRPLGIIIGFILTFTLFTYFSKEIIKWSQIDPEIIRNISFVILVLIGVIMISDYLTTKFEIMTQKIGQWGDALTINFGEGFWNGIGFGGLIGLIWTPCAGPILAAVIVQTVLQKTSFYSFLTLLAFSIGVALPMLFIIYFGQSLLKYFMPLKKHSTLIRKLLGLLIVLSVLAIYFNIGSYFTKDLGQTSQSNNESISEVNGLKNKLEKPYLAPPIEGIEEWINSKPLNLNELKGKVVLIDFWSYSCINCIRTFPYLREWYQKYHDKGLIIIGVHTPEFDFERKLENVKEAAKRDDLRYPIALDNQYKTWQNYQNRYWPAHYLIDKNGFVVYQHSGEGNYKVTEHNIRYLLGITDTSTESSEKNNFSFGLTPETYLGYERENQYSSPEKIKKGESQNYHYPDNLPLNAWALNGNWTISAEKIIAEKDKASIRLYFNAKKVFTVMGSRINKPIKVKVLLNGQVVKEFAGKDLVNSEISVSQHQLYDLINLKSVSDGIIELVAEEPGLEIYTFTFGN